MKKLILFTLILIIFSCQNDQVAPNHGKGKAQFSLSPVNRDGGRTSGNESPVSVLVSIEDGNGNSVVENKKLSIWSLGQGYVSESLELTEGDYKLIQFLVLNASDTITYASPMVGSELAKYVNNPLPVSFTISKDASTTVTPQVLKVESTDNPASFGYVNFGFEVVEIPAQTPKLIEIWQDEPWDIHYKTYFSYSGDFLIKQTSFYFWSNDWKLMDSTTFDYNTDGKLSEKNSYYVFDLQPDQQPTATFTTTFEYYNDGRLKTMIGTNYNTNDHLIEFFYDAQGKPTYSNHKFYPSLSMRYQIKYEVNNDGEIINTKYYNGNGNTLMFEYKYTFDESVSPIPFYYEYDPNRILQKHNIASQQTIGYNIISGELTESYSCQFSVSYEITNGLVTMSTISNPNGCFETNFDQTQFTYIYE